jgi:DNA-binding NarL/FixJ family response regulator
VYTTEALAALLEGVARTLPTSFSVRSLDEIFRLLLTDLIPSDLDEDDIDEHAQAAVERDPARTAVLQNVVARIIGRLTGEQKVVLKMKAADVADGEIAMVIGVSRPTIADRKHEIFELIRSETTDMDDGEREDAVTLTLEALTKGLDD